MMKVLVTGGAGSIGSETVGVLVRSGYDVRVLDVNEEGLWCLQSDYPNIDARIGDVQFDTDVQQAMHGINMVVHCAAYKHVHLCERSIEAAYRVNVGGTNRILDAACGRRVVLLSTDKAVRAHSVMGQSKAMAESMILHSRNANIVRFGNVLGSRGSLVPVVIRHALRGRPIPLTDPNMTRFFMPISEAVDLIIEAMESKQSGKVYVPKKLHSAKIGLFLEVCRDLYAPQSEIKEVGPRPGESLHECMKNGNGKISCSDDPKLLMTRKQIEILLSIAIDGKRVKS